MDEVLFAIAPYFLSKVCFLIREVMEARGNMDAARRWKMAAWTFSLLGLPFVSWIFFHERDWIFGWLELGTGPSMVFGLAFSWRNKGEKVPKRIDRIVWITFAGGVAFSAYDFGTLMSINQGLEIFSVVVFFLGTRLLAKDDRNGYLWYLCMFFSAGSILLRQGHDFFAYQQVASALCIGSAYLIWRYKPMFLLPTK